MANCAATVPAAGLKYVGTIGHVDHGKTVLTAAVAKALGAAPQETPAQPVNYPTEITRSLVEEFSGQVFEYQEILPVFESYVPDRKPADVAPETRALADVCLLLLNGNEFLYVE